MASPKTSNFFELLLLQTKFWVLSGRYIYIAPESIVTKYNELPSSAIIFSLHAGFCGFNCLAGSISESSYLAPIHWRRVIGKYRIHTFAASVLTHNLQRMHTGIKTSGCTWFMSSRTLSETARLKVGDAYHVGKPSRSTQLLGRKKKPQSSMTATVVLNQLKAALGDPAANKKDQNKRMGVV